jgi:hypothetical protein
MDIENPRKKALYYHRQVKDEWLRYQRVCSQVSTSNARQCAQACLRYLYKGGLFKELDIPELQELLDISTKFLNGYLDPSNGWADGFVMAKREIRKQIEILNEQKKRSSWSDIYQQVVSYDGDEVVFRSGKYDPTLSAEDILEDLMKRHDLKKLARLKGESGFIVVTYGSKVVGSIDVEIYVNAKTYKELVKDAHGNVAFEDVD